MAVTVTNVLMGPGVLYSGAFQATEPLDASVNAAPAASAWTDVGGTDGGVKLGIDQKYTELNVDQIVDSIGRRLTAREILVDTNLAEPTLVNLSLALNGGTAASGANWSSYDPLYATSATQPTYVALIIDGYAPSATATPFRRRIVVRRCLQTGKMETSYTRDKQKFYPVSFNAHYVTVSIPPFHVVDQTA